MQIRFKAATADALVIHYNEVIMGAMATQITSLTNVYSNVYSGADQRRHQKLRITGFCVGNSPVTPTHKWPVTWKMFPFGDVIMQRSLEAVRYKGISYHRTMTAYRIKFRYSSHECFYSSQGNSNESRPYVKHIRIRFLVEYEYMFIPNRTFQTLYWFNA